MCGITGALALNHKGINTAWAKPMTDILAHRGPDDAGYLFFHTGCRHERNVSFEIHLTDDQFKHISELLPSIDSRAGQAEVGTHDWDLFMGHRRLAILDVTPAGHQPMSDLTKNVWLVYNGEVYNFKELREELKTQGHRFRIGTDTEVVLYAYIQWGIQCVERFNGMFAFALYDNFAKKLYLARDRYGIKPLYYAIVKKPDGDHTLIFASEVKSIIEYKGYQTGIDYEALIEYFTFQNIFTDRTLYKDVKLLPPATYLTIDLPSLSETSSFLPREIPSGQQSAFHRGDLSASCPVEFRRTAERIQPGSAFSFYNGLQANRLRPITESRVTYFLMTVPQITLITYATSLIMYVSPISLQVDNVPRYSLYNATHRVAFPIVAQGRHPGEVISELNAWPAFPPVNASRAASRLPAHDSGP
jgi:asparagine synthetase B (glutamine-hydrolysing)